MTKAGGSWRAAACRAVPARPPLPPAIRPFRRGRVEGATRFCAV
jgi:hypothetical protein